MQKAINSIGFLLGLAALVALASPLSSIAGRPSIGGIVAQSSAPKEAPPRESDRKTSKPYSGDLSIFEDPERAKRLQVDRVMDVLGLADGSTVADIGAGSGWFTVRAARRVAPHGRVFAVDINQQYLDYIAARTKKEGLENVVEILGSEDDARLPAGSVDAVLVLKTYHEIAKPVTLMSRLHSSMRPSGVVGIIDRNGNGEDHGISPDVIVDEMGRAGFELRDRYDFVKGDKMDYFLVFTVRKS